MALIQLIYSSAAVKPLSEVELSRILLAARRNNSALGISGMLVYHDGSFLQVLEGEEKGVETLFERIGKDARHCRVMTLLRRSIDAPQFKDWSMGFLDIKGIAGALPGYSDFLRSRSDPARAGSMAAEVLAQFGEGKFRNSVNYR